MIPFRVCKKVYKNVSSKQLDMIRDFRPYFMQIAFIAVYDDSYDITVEDSPENLQKLNDILGYTKEERA